MVVRQQNKTGTFSEYQWEIINFVKVHQGMKYRDIERMNGWPSSTISGTILGYERATGERIGVIGTKPRKDFHEPSLTQKKVISYLLTHPDATLSECSDVTGVAPSYVSMTTREYLPERHRIRPKKYNKSPRLPGESGTFTIIPCLCCDRPFPSRDVKTNRLCQSCNDSASGGYDDPYSVNAHTTTSHSSMFRAFR